MKKVYRSAAEALDGLLHDGMFIAAGSLDPDMIHLPGIYVNRLIQGEHEKRIEQRTTRAA